MPIHAIDVSASGNTIWVNSGIDGSCIGRFSKTFGMDVHRTATEQISGKGECLHCTHGPAGPEEWKQFIALMRKHYDVVIAPNPICFQE